MRVLMSLLALVALFSVLALGNSNVMATHGEQAAMSGEMTQCEKDFARMDGGNKGYLSVYEFEEGFYGLGGHKGLGPTGAASTVFASADRSGDNRLDIKEYCAWKAY